ncbi:MAG: VOC family protein [Actinomycetes bacterium]
MNGELAVAIDCADLGRAAAFWGALLGYVPAGPGSARYRHLIPEDGPGIVVVLQRVPDAKTGKSRVHLDLRTRDLAGEVERALKLGATRLTEEPIPRTAGAGTSSPIPTATSSVCSSRRPGTGSALPEATRRVRGSRKSGRCRR